MENRVCSQCKEEKPLGEFYYRQSRDEYESACKACLRSKAAAYRNRPDVVEKRRKPGGYADTDEGRRAHDERRFWSMVNKSDGCWLWTGPVTEDGYGRFQSRLLWLRLRTHRFSWILANGPITGDLAVCHRCDTPLCVRPDHLFLGTVADNNHDCAAKGRARVEGKVKRGEANGRSVLTEDKARQIKVRIGLGESLSHLASEYGVSATVIGHIKIGKLWRHVQVA